jgi:hypothetical protein
VSGSLIWLPHTFAKFAGLPTRICQTVHDRALDFLVVIIAGTENAAESAKASIFTRRRFGVLISAENRFFLQSDTLETSIRAFSDTRIMEKKKHNKDKK